MKVQMVIGISGGRGDGAAWPARGGLLDVDDEEGAALCAGGLAVPVLADNTETPESALEPEIEIRGESPAPPSVRASRAEWAAYAAACGQDPAGIAQMTKAELVARSGSPEG